MRQGAALDIESVPFSGLDIFLGEASLGGVLEGGGGVFQGGHAVYSVVLGGAWERIARILASSACSSGVSTGGKKAPSARETTAQ